MNDERLRFNRLMEELHGISPRTLSDRLKELRAEGLIEIPNSLFSLKRRCIPFQGRHGKRILLGHMRVLAESGLNCEVMT